MRHHLPRIRTTRLLPNRSGQPSFPVNPSQHSRDRKPAPPRILSRGRCTEAFNPQHPRPLPNQPSLREPLLPLHHHLIPVQSSSWGKNRQPRLPSRARSPAQPRPVLRF
jgi:hypothetical protein